MRVRDGFIELTWKEDLYAGPAGRRDLKIPRWKRLLAPLQHVFAVLFQGHQSGDPHRCFDFNDHVIPGRGRPEPLPIDLPDRVVFTGELSIADFTGVTKDQPI